MFPIIQAAIRKNDFFVLFFFFKQVRKKIFKNNRLVEMNISLEGIASIFLEGNEWLWERRTQKLLGMKWNEIIPPVQARILKTSASLVHALQNNNPGKEAVLGDH